MKSWIAAVVYIALATGANAADPGALASLRAGSMKKLALHESPRAVPAIPITGPQGAVTLADFPGEVLVVNFWATWCAPCRKEMPSLAALDAALQGKDARVLAVATGRTTEGAVSRFLEQTGSTSLSVYYDPRQELARAMDVRGLPTTLILDRQGREVARLTGDAEWDSPSALAILAALLSDAS